MIFFSLFSTALSSVFYGILATAAIMALLLLVLKAISPTMVQTPVFLITGVVLAAVLVVQTSLMIGAMQAKSAARGAEIYVSQLIEDRYEDIGARDSQEIIDAIADEFPVIGNYINMANFAGTDVAELPETIYETMADYLNTYIWHRVWWILGAIVVAVTIAALGDRPTTGRPSAKRRTARRTTQLARHSNRQRIYRGR